MKRTGSAVWKGGLKDGTGTLATESGVLKDQAYSFAKRFGDEKGTNPEELIAAAHAACFSMALSNILAQNGHPPDSVRTVAKVHLGQQDGKPTIHTIDLETEGKVPGLDENEFRTRAEEAKAGCPVSRVLGGVDEINLTARLV